MVFNFFLGCKFYSDTVGFVTVGPASISSNCWCYHGWSMCCVGHQMWTGNKLSSIWHRQNANLPCKFSIDLHLDFSALWHWSLVLCQGLEYLRFRRFFSIRREQWCKFNKTKIVEFFYSNNNNNNNNNNCQWKNVIFTVSINFSYN